MEPLKIGVIGTGNISQFHLGAYQKNPRVQLYAVCDLNPDRARKAAETFGVAPERVYTDMNEMLALKEIDAVSVCT